MSTEPLEPDVLLQAIQTSEAGQSRGRLKIFLGMAPGVGKTCAMLTAARRLQREEGCEVVIGLLETHGRPETAALAEGLETLPRQPNGELALDALLRRRPELVLIDDLAHGNAPDSRHARRYQDVLELLGAGLDVWTTVNIQHLESRSDTVHQITGLAIPERIPDTMLDLADDVTLIDLPPDELLERLAEGKIYAADSSAEQARLFHKGHLTALREMALRVTAEHVDQDLQAYLRQHRPGRPWRSQERLLVGVGASPMSAELLRWTRRMAGSLIAPWVAVHVTTARPLAPADQQRLSENLDLARELGAEIVITSGSNLLSTLMETARQQHATQLILGKPQQSWWRDLFNGSFLTFHSLMHARSGVDIWVVDSSRREKRTLGRPLRLSRVDTDWREYLLTLASMGGLTLLSGLLVGWIGYWSVALIFLLGVMALAFALRRGPVLLAAGLSALLWNFFFIPPLYTLHIQNLHDNLMCLVYFITATLMAGLTTRVRAQEAQGRQREARLAMLYRYTRQLGAAEGEAQLLAVARSAIQEALQAEALYLRVKGPGQLAQGELEPAEWEAARWAFEHQRPAGRFTDTLPGTQGHYLPLFTAEGVYGVLGIYAPNLSFEQRQLLESLSHQLALALERELLQEAATRHRLTQISEALYNALLNSVSHELRTPITTIQGAVQNLQTEEVQAAPALRQAMQEDLLSASRRLEHLVANLLDMSRLQSGKITLHQAWCDVCDIVRAAIKTLQRELREYPLSLELPAETPPIQADFGLLEQALINVIHNALVHNQPGTAIAIAVSVASSQLRIRIADRGKGIPEASLPQLFEKFYRAPGARSGGTGLGLSIARGFIEAHGGTIRASNQPEGGACFLIELPVSELPGLPAEADSDAAEDDDDPANSGRR